MGQTSFESDIIWYPSLGRHVHCIWNRLHRNAILCGNPLFEFASYENDSLKCNGTYFVPSPLVTKPAPMQGKNLPRILTKESSQSTHPETRLIEHPSNEAHPVWNPTSVWSNLPSECLVIQEIPFLILYIAKANR